MTTITDSNLKLYANLVKNPNFETAISTIMDPDKTWYTLSTDTDVEITNIENTQTMQTKFACEIGTGTCHSDTKKWPGILYQIITNLQPNVAYVLRFNIKSLSQAKVECLVDFDGSTVVRTHDFGDTDTFHRVECVVTATTSITVLSFYAASSDVARQSYMISDVAITKMIPSLHPDTEIYALDTATNVFKNYPVSNLQKNRHRLYDVASQTYIDIAHNAVVQSFQDFVLIKKNLTSKFQPISDVYVQPNLEIYLSNLASPATLSQNIPNSSRVKCNTRSHLLCVDKPNAIIYVSQLKTLAVDAKILSAANVKYTENTV